MVVSPQSQVTSQRSAHIQYERCDSLLTRVHTRGIFSPPVLFFPFPPASFECTVVPSRFKMHPAVVIFSMRIRELTGLSVLNVPPRRASPVNRFSASLVQHSAFNLVGLVWSNLHRSPTFSPRLSSSKVALILCRPGLCRLEEKGWLGLLVHCNRFRLLLRPPVLTQLPVSTNRSTQKFNYHPLRLVVRFRILSPRDKLAINSTPDDLLVVVRATAYSPA